ncbi:MAG: sulfatase, partial [Paenibacillus sp. RIFOXYA1_FULL_44_5]
MFKYVNSNFQTKHQARSYFIVFMLIFFAKLLILRHFTVNKFTFFDILADFVSALMITSLVELLAPRKIKWGIYLAVNLLFSFIFFSATLYFDHFGSIVTYTSLQELGQISKISDSISATIKPYYYVYFPDMFILLGVFLAERLAKKKMLINFSYKKSYISVLFVIGMIVSIIYVTKGDKIINELNRTAKMGFINYQVSLVLTAKAEASTSGRSISQIKTEVEQLEASYPYRSSTAPIQFFGTAKGMNVIVVQMEAFQNFLINLRVDGQEVTPNLNKLMQDSFYFPHVFQQIGPGNTSDAEFMSNTSIYPTGTEAMSSGYGDRSLPSLPKQLEAIGYEADTFHVNDVTFWNRIELYPAIGFSHYFDKPYFADANDNFNSFGASDEVLYKKGLEKLNALAQAKKPFYAQFITVSSHYPFTIPEDQKRIKLPDSMKDSQLADYIYAQNYTDYAIGKLIEQLKANGMWKHTVLVAYGDHFGLQPKDTDPQFVTKELGIPYDSHVSRFNIPLFIHVPGVKGSVVKQVGGQLDIMPTVANLLGVNLKKQQFTHFGHDLLNIDRNAFGMRYYLPTGSFFNNDILFVPGNGFDDGTAISIDTLQPVAD